jgi:ABC-type taurine transport system substrate-binding protein
MLRTLIKTSFFGLALTLAAFAARPASADPITVGYSDWPGWVAWQVAIDKGWFKEAGLDVKFQWFDYSASMEAFAAGKIDANCMTNGDTLVTGAGGGKGIMIMLTDYSDGNDMIVGKPGIKSLPDLKGKKVGLEVGLVEHLLLLNGLKKNGMSESDVSLVNSKTNETPQVLASGQVDAIGAWQPISNLGTYTNFVNLMDLAALSVPAGFRPDGIPFGVTLIGPAFSDGMLASVGDALHRSFAGAQLGATSAPLSSAPPVPPQSRPTHLVRVAVLGAHLSGPAA